MIGQELLIIIIPFEKPKTEVHIFDRATFPGFARREFRTKQDFNTKKQVLLLTKLRSCLLKNKRKYDLFSMKKAFMQEIFVVLKLSTFYFEISTFCSPGCCIGFIFHLLQLVCGVQSMAQFYRCESRVHRRQGFKFQ